MNVHAAIKQAYSQGAPGIMNATSPAKLHDILQKSDIRSVSKLIMHKLHYQEIKHRYKRIALAHQETFE